MARENEIERASKDEIEREGKDEEYLRVGFSGTGAERWNKFKLGRVYTCTNICMKLKRVPVFPTLLRKTSFSRVAAGIAKRGIRKRDTISPAISSFSSNSPFVVARCTVILF